MADYTQSERPISVTTPLGKDVLLLTSFTGQEEVSRLYAYDLELLSTNDAIDPKQIVGKNVTFMIKHQDGSPRHFNGIVNRFAYCGRGDRLSVYRMQVVPSLWLLSRKSDCRIFQEKSVPDIIKEIFGELGITDFEATEIKGSHPTWEYCVQYRETSLNFISRLMEQEGIFYFFRHEDGKHTLVLSDQKGAFKTLKDSDVEFAANLSVSQQSDTITSWEHQYEFRTGKWAQTDYNFEQPDTSLMANVKTLVKLDDNTNYEFYDYPGEYSSKSDGDADTKIRMEEEEVPYNTIRGSGICRTFSPGGKFTVSKHHSASETGKSYVVTSVRHTASIGNTYETGGTSAGLVYHNSFTCIPDSVNFRPARITPKPVVHGAQTAVVVGPPGEEIWPDKYGRVKVQFHWDRLGQKDEKSSCWVRCMQGTAGKGWGSMHLPRIGQEVVVSYLEGDPDQPLISGLVYNANQMPGYTLPDERTKSYIKTNSSPGGDGFNEIRFEDKKDSEQLFIHAQKNMDLRVLNDQMSWIRNDSHLIIGNEDEGKVGDQIERVFRDKHQNIKQHQVEHIEGNYQLMVGEGDANDGGSTDIYIEKKAALFIGPDGCKTVIEGDRDEKVGGRQTLDLTGDRIEKVAGSQSLTVSGDQKEKVGSHSLTTDLDQHIKVGMNQAVEAGMSIHIKAGMTLVLEAGIQLTLKAGASFIDIGPAGVSISGVPLVNINSGGAAGSGSGANPQTPATPQPPSKSDIIQASPLKPVEADDSQTGQKSC